MIRSAGQPVFINFGPRDSVLYTIKSLDYSYECKRCDNSLVVQEYSKPFNNFDDKVSGTCNKCDVIYSIRYV